LSVEGRLEVGMSVDTRRIEIATRELLVALGEDLEREGLKDTPHRVAKFWKEFLSPKPPVCRVFSERYDDLVIMRGIPVHSICEHHLLPFFGEATVGYVAANRLVGLSKIVRIVTSFSQRLQMQERLTNQIADYLYEKLQPEGVAVLIEALHLCMVYRGVKVEGAKTITSAMRGAFLENDALRAEFLTLACKKEG